ncbi:unnamed protein product [Musa hybrid cultivar]
MFFIDHTITSRGRREKKISDLFTLCSVQEYLELWDIKYDRHRVSSSSSSGPLLPETTPTFDGSHGDCRLWTNAAITRASSHEPKSTIVCSWAWPAFDRMNSVAIRDVSQSATRSFSCQDHRSW